MLETALGLASRGQCKICCPIFVVASANKRLQPQFCLKLDITQKHVRLPKMKVYLVKRKSAKESQEMKRLAKFIRQTLNELNHTNNF